ncbi:protein CD300H-like isoform X2 [Dromiciops gliroides]|uniref:protein CD300H-like isoform X2 n=1 Tax=Dromiciops gliroides TaxID=33562 RepID=UPI001CC70E76|nr:protein CD300H-like isoform X2 [Dromiciops gliroides]
MSEQVRLPLLLLPLTSILLFLCPKDCLSLSGPTKVTGIVGESLTVQCFYEEKYKTNRKYFCKKNFHFLCETTYSNIKTMNTQESKVSVRDHPENQTFIITMENLTKADEGVYWCGIDQFLLDDILTITIVVSPASTVAPNRYTTISLADILVTDILVTDIKEIGGVKTSEEISDPMQIQKSGILGKPGVLLLILGLLIISLAGALVLAWRLVEKQKKGGEKSMVFPYSTPQNEELCYVNLELPERPSNRDPSIQSHPGVEYSAVMTAQEQSVTYSILTFPMDNQNTALETKKYPEEKVVYSTIMIK